PSQQARADGRVDADLRAQDRTGGWIAGEGDAVGIGRPSRREGDGVKHGELMLIGAVIVHLPDLFVAAARANEGDLRRSNSGESPREPRDDLISKLVCVAAGLLFV